MNRQAAFTRSDALGAISILCLLIFLALPAISATRRVASTALCQANMRTLNCAWQLYAAEYHGTFVSNHHGASISGPRRELERTLNWARGWLDWSTAFDNTNTTLLRSPRQAALADYLDGVKGNVHKCPADLFLSRVQKARGWQERVRTVVMNATVGGGNARNGAFDSIYAQAANFSEMIYPGPAQTSIFLEEHADSINDTLAYAPFRTSWIDVFGALHGNAGMVAFADGHVELHRWRQSLRNFRVSTTGFRSPNVRSGDADISWVSFHATAAIRGVTEPSPRPPRKHASSRACSTGTQSVCRPA